MQILPPIHLSHWKRKVNVTGTNYSLVFHRDRYSDHFYFTSCSSFTRPSECLQTARPRVPQSCQHLWKTEPTEDAEAVMHDLVFLRDKWVYRKVKRQWRSIAVIRFMNYEGKYKERVQRRQSVLYVRMTEKNRAVGPTAKSQNANSHWLASITLNNGCELSVWFHNADLLAWI